MIAMIKGSVLMAVCLIGLEMGFVNLFALRKIVNEMEVIVITSHKV